MKLSDQDKARKEDLTHAWNAARLALEGAIVDYNIVVDQAKLFASEVFVKIENHTIGETDAWRETVDGRAFARWMRAWDRASAAESAKEPDFGDIAEWDDIPPQP